MGVDTWAVGPGRKSGHLFRELVVQSIRESKESIRPFPGDDVSRADPTVGAGARTSRAWKITAIALAAAGSSCQSKAKFL